MIWFPEPVQIDKFSFVTADNSPSWDPKQWVMEVSIDGTSWKLLHIQNTDFSLGERLTQTDWFPLDLVSGEQVQQPSLLKGDAVAWAGWHRHLPHFVHVLFNASISCLSRTARCARHWAAPSTFGVIHTRVGTVSNHWIRVAFQIAASLDDQDTQSESVVSEWIRPDAVRKLSGEQLLQELKAVQNTSDLAALRFRIHAAISAELLAEDMQQAKKTA